MTISNQFICGEETVIIVELEALMSDRKISVNELAEKVGRTNVNISRIKTGKTKAIRFSTLDALCKSLKCQPGDLLKYK